LPYANAWVHALSQEGGKVVSREGGKFCVFLEERFDINAEDADDQIHADQALSF
jgi:hypothetical protein